MCRTHSEIKPECAVRKFKASDGDPSLSSLDLIWLHLDPVWFSLDPPNSKLTVHGSSPFFIDFLHFAYPGATPPANGCTKIANVHSADKYRLFGKFGANRRLRDCTLRFAMLCNAPSFAVQRLSGPIRRSPYSGNLLSEHCAGFCSFMSYYTEMLNTKISS